jgi:hypothetical protein
VADPAWRRGMTPTFLGLGFGFLLHLISILTEPIPLLLISAGLRSRAWASAHGVSTPLTRKSETLGDS